MTRASMIALLATLTAGAASLVAQPRCTPADLNENWSFIATGHFVAVPGVPLTGPFARMAQVTFDGAGKFTSGYERGNYAGVAVTDPFTGTYTVNSDCTATFIADVPPPIGFQVPFFGVISESKNELRLLIVGPGAPVSGVLRKQGIYGCGTSVLQGGYALDLAGTGLTGTPNPGPTRILGAVRFDGAGGFGGAGVASYNGVITPEAWSGTYTIDFGCRVTINYRTGTAATAHKLEGSLVDGGKGIFVQYTSDPKFVLNGTLKLQ